MDAPWPWERRIIGRWVPVVGMVMRNCKGTRRPGIGRVRGLRERVGVVAAVGMCFARPMRAWSGIGADMA